MNIAYVLIGKTVGGAEKRISNLYNYFMNNNVLSEFNFYLIVSYEIYSVINMMIPNLNHKNLIIKPSIVKPLTINNTNLIKKINPKPIKKRFKNLRKFVNELFEWKRLISDAIYLNKIYRKYKIDITHTITQGSFATAILKLFVKRPIHILSYMDVYCDNVEKGLSKIPSSYYLSLKYADLIDFLGDTYKINLEKLDYKFNNDRFLVAPCSFIQFNEYPIANKTNLVVFVARFDKKKNPFLFIDVAKIILSRRNDIEFKIFGHGNLHGEIIKYLSINNLDKKIKVEFAYDTSKVFLKSKVFLSLQEIDNYPSQSIIEAMYHRNVVIASNVGDTNKIVNETNGYLVNFNPYEISYKIEYLIDNPNVFEVLSNESYNFIKEKHNIENYTKYLAELYKIFDCK